MVMGNEAFRDVETPSRSLSPAELTGILGDFCGPKNIGILILSLLLALYFLLHNAPVRSGSSTVNQAVIQISLRITVIFSTNWRLSPRDSHHHS